MRDETSANSLLLGRRQQARTLQRCFRKCIGVKHALDVMCAQELFRGRVHLQRSQTLLQTEDQSDTRIFQAVK